jgi:hypothetical protein
MHSILRVSSAWSIAQPRITYYYSIIHNINVLTKISATAQQSKTLSRRLIRLDQHLRKARNALRATHFLDEQGHLDDVEVLTVQVVDLLEVLLLHLTATVALRARVRGAGEQ